MVLRRKVAAHIVCVFSEQDMLVAVPNNISITSFNNSADTANAPRETPSSTPPANTVRTATRPRFDSVGNSVLVLREWRNTTLLLNVRPPLHFTQHYFSNPTHKFALGCPFSSCQRCCWFHQIRPLPRLTHQFCTGRCTTIACGVVGGP
jgi:hypothetical protein